MNQLCVLEFFLHRFSVNLQMNVVESLDEHSFQVLGMPICLPLSSDNKKRKN